MAHGTGSFFDRTAPRRLLAAALLLSALSACASSTAVPRAQNNICAIFDQHPSWRRATADVERKYGAPTPLVMAIIWRESSFRHDARPPRARVFFGLIPWGRVSSAYGYSQALDGTWEWYLRDTGRSDFWTDRDDFDDAADFVGWYMTKTRQINGVAMGDAVSQYLAYHEGHRGYRTKTYRGKAWLLRAARQVENMSNVYARQLRSCR
ncbi:MAG: hypothetical protein AAGM38_11125 [Pseudomonadota bacterium]